MKNSSGFKRVYGECKKNNVATKYVINKEGFAFVFMRNVVNGVANDVVNNNLSSDEKMILKLIKENSNLTALEIASIMHKKQRTIQMIMSSMKSRGFQRIGGTRGYWSIIEKLKYD